MVSEKHKGRWIMQLIGLLILIILVVLGFVLRGKTGGT
jgi:hypothetical protein